VDLLLRMYLGTMMVSRSRYQCSGVIYFQESDVLEDKIITDSSWTAM
jgi:hypothetical protein